MSIGPNHIEIKNSRPAPQTLINKQLEGTVAEPRKEVELASFKLDIAKTLQEQVSTDKVLVVGTTSDYIDWLRTTAAGRAIFITDPDVRYQALEQSPHQSEEILCELYDSELVCREVRAHLRRWNLSVNGVTCFDCESMELAAELASQLGLPYPTVKSIRLSRDKYMTKNTWLRNGVACPQVRLVKSAAEVIEFYDDIEAPCVLKPLSGSGSELVFFCATPRDCQRRAQLMIEGLASRADQKLYYDASIWFLAEEYVAGEEYSCDFMVKDGRVVDVVRLTRKIKNPEKPFGTIDAYVLTDWQDVKFERTELLNVLQGGASGLSLDYALCMVDFLVNDDGKVILLEMTPRLGGDCLPFLLRNACGRDVLSFGLDFAQGFATSHPLPTGGMTALRLHADRDGVIFAINADRLRQDPRVREVHMVRRVGHRVVMPPIEYDSWYLGHVIFQPSADEAVAQQCRQIRGLLGLEINND